MPQGYLSLVLHAHLPFVRHPEQADYLEEDWFYEAVTETYLPLLEMWRRLAWDSVPCRMTINLSPTLLTMFRDPLLMERYERRLERLLELVEKEVGRTRWQGEFNETARHYQDRLTRMHRLTPRNSTAIWSAVSAPCRNRVSWKSSPAPPPTAICRS